MDARPQRTRVADAERAQATRSPARWPASPRAPRRSRSRGAPGRDRRFRPGRRPPHTGSRALPGRGGPGEVAGDLQGIRLGQVVSWERPARRLATAARRIRPVSQRLPRVEDEVTHRLRFFPRSRAVALQESRFGARGADRPQAQQFTGALGQRQRLVERRRGLGTATASAHLAQRRQRHHPRHRR